MTTTQPPQLPTESGRGSCLAPSRSTDAPVDGAADRYERLFPDLPRIEGDEERLLGLAGPGSVCDGGDACADARRGRRRLALLRPVHRPRHHRRPQPAGPPGRAADASNFRTPRADLECIYGDGPVGNPFLYRRDDPAKLLLGATTRGEEADLPRNREGIALIGDPRNDIHIFVSQLHLAMLRLHNRLVDRLRAARRCRRRRVFDEARRDTSPGTTSG